MSRDFDFLHRLKQMTVPSRQILIWMESNGWRVGLCWCEIWTTAMMNGNVNKPHRKTCSKWSTSDTEPLFKWEQCVCLSLRLWPATVLKSLEAGDEWLNLSKVKTQRWIQFTSGWYDFSRMLSTNSTARSSTINTVSVFI